MSNTARNAIALLKEQNLYYKDPIQVHILASLKRRTAYLIKRSEDDIGVGHKFIRTYRIDVTTYLGVKAWKYLERCLDASDYTFRVSSTYNWDSLERLGMTRGYTRKSK